MDRQPNNQQMRREYATYRYLNALDAGDIDTIGEILQLALYDASLEQMLLDAHQAYFLEEQEQGQSQRQKDTLTSMETQPEIPAIVPLPPQKRRNRQKRSVPRWIYTLVAVLIVGVLVGSFVTLLNIRRAGLGHGTPPTSTVTPTCQSYPLKLFDIPTNGLVTLNAVTTISTHDAWAVGFSASNPASTSTPVIRSPLIEHWNGTSWQIVPSPTITNGNGILSAVAALSTNNVWAIGYTFDGIPTSTQPVGVSKTLVEHWNGRSWQVIASPSGPTGNGIFNGLAVLSQNDIWAVGLFTDASQTIHPLIEHWNGTSWQMLSVQSSGTTIGWLSDVAAVSASDIWAVGPGRNAGDAVTHGLIEHWNGSQWQSIPASPSMKILYSVSVLSAKDIWVVGSDGNGGPLLAQWNGQQWNTFTPPSSIMGTSVNLTKVVAITASDVWAVGYTRTALKHTQCCSFTGTESSGNK